MKHKVQAKGMVYGDRNEVIFEQMRIAQVVYNQVEAKLTNYLKATFGQFEDQLNKRLNEQKQQTNEILEVYSSTYNAFVVKHIEHMNELNARIAYLEKRLEVN